MKRLRNLALLLLILAVAAIIFVYTLYNNQISAISDSEQVIVIEVEEGMSVQSIATLLETEKLIKNELFFRIYVELNEITNLQAGTYELTPAMDIKSISLSLQEGRVIRPDEISITIKEGINIKKLAEVIKDNTNNTEEDVYEQINNTTYINSLITKYWFMTNDIKNENIYYSLEGYLFPETYNFADKDVSVETIFNKMIDQMDSELEEYKDDIEKSEYSVHELLTLASIIEKEGVYAEDRKIIAGVFYNRLEIDMPLGSDVTTCYGIGLELSECDLNTEQLAMENYYNTRNTSFVGLPIGPICLLSKEAIDAVFQPESSDYYFFVADKNMKIYFGKTNAEHVANISLIKENGDWFTY